MRRALLEAAGERIRFQNPELAADGRDRTARQIDVSMRQRGLDEEVFQTQQILERLPCQADGERHGRAVVPRFFGVRREIRSSRRVCIASSASLAA